MASETFVSAMMLITAVVASAILITAVFPIVWNMVSTFSSASHETDSRMRTDFRIVATYAKPSPTPEGDIYLKNVGTNRISFDEINRSDVFFGETGAFTRLSFTSGSIGSGQWGYVFTAGSYDMNSNQMWDTGETIEIIANPIIPDPILNPLSSGDSVYFQFILPNSVERSEEFTVS